MANFVLFVSSVISASIHLLGFIYTGQPNNILIYSITIGIATSIWNHGTTSTIAKYMDRVMMWLGFFTDLYLALDVKDYWKSIVCMCMLGTAGGLYFLAKFFINNQIVRTTIKLPSSLSGQWYIMDLPHLCAHASLTLTHLLLMVAYTT